MKIAFWSNMRGKACVTSNLACMSVLSILDSKEQNGRTILFENHQSIINLGNILFCQYSENEMKQKSRYRVKKGLNGVWGELHNNSFSDELILQNAECYLEQKLCYFPTDLYANADMFEYHLEKECDNLLEYLDWHSSYVYIDTSPGPMKSSREILRGADIVVVNLIQNEAMLEHFFRNYSAIHKKAFYLIGNYDEQSYLNLEKIQNKYHISSNRIAAIPRNRHFAEAISSGQVIPFLTNRKRVDKQFFDMAEQAVFLLKDMASREEGTY